MAEPITWEYYERAERDMFSLSGIPDDCIIRKSVPVGKDNKGEEMTIRTAIVKAEGDTDGGKPDFVLVHGYGG